MKNKITYIILIAISIFSCEKPVENFEIEKKDPKLVLYAALQSDSISRINLSKSLDIFAPDDFIPIKDATVEIIENETNKYILTPDTGGFYYSNNFIIKPNNKYEIKASANGFEPINSTIIIPSKPEIISFDTSISYESPYFDCFECEKEYILNVNIKFNDNATIEDFYMAEAYIWYKEYTHYKEIYLPDSMGDFYPEYIPTDSIIYYRNIYLNTSSKFIEISNSHDYYSVSTPDYLPNGNKYYFSDKLINGKEIELNLKINEWELINIASDSLFITFSKITKSHFDFISSLARAWEVEGNPLAEQVTIYNNIENGLGNAYGKTSEKIIIDVGELIKMIPKNEEEKYYY